MRVQANGLSRLGSRRGVSGQIFGVRNNEIFLFSQPRPVRTIHRSEGWTPEKIDSRSRARSGPRSRRGALDRRVLLGSRCDRSWHRAYRCGLKTMADKETQQPADDLGANRESVRALCAKFPGEYWRGLTRARPIPVNSSRRWTQAGFLAALIPEDYGGSGLR